MCPLALGIYCHSSAAYEALKGFSILSPPANSSLQLYSGAFIYAPGASTACIADQVSCYVIYKEECRKLGKQRAARTWCTNF